MSIKLKELPYLFDDGGGNQHHFGRCYISDYKKSYKLLYSLKKYRSLLLADIPIVFGTARSENRREHFIELWRSGFDIGVLRMGSSRYAWADLSLEAINEEKISIETIKRRAEHPYTLFFLDLLNKNKNGLTEKEVGSKLFTKDSNGNVNRGSTDQVHPTMDDLSRWKWIAKSDNKGRVVTSKGLQILNKNSRDNIHFICFKADLNGDKVKARILWSILRDIDSNKNVPTYPTLFDQKIPFKMNLNSVLERYHNNGLGTMEKISGKKVISLLDDLDIRYEKSNSNNIILNEKIFFSITPSGYVSSGLSQMDKIDQYLPKKEMSNDADSISNQDITKHDYWIITERELDDSNDMYSMSNNEWLETLSSLDKYCPKAIFLDEKWNTAVMEASCGYLLSFVRKGGALIINGQDGGRIGTNKQFFNWLPPDFERLNFIPSSRKWTFDSNRLDKKSVEPIYCKSFLPPNIGKKNQDHFSSKYGLGFFIFEAKIFDKYIIRSIIEKYKLNEFKNVVLKDSSELKYANIAQIHRTKEITKEQQIYPILGKEILNQVFGFILSESFCYSWEGSGSIKSNVDLFTIYPNITLWEVDSLKGKTSSNFGGLAGDSVAIDIGHATKTPIYKNQAKSNYDNLIIMLSNFPDKESTAPLLNQYIENEVKKINTSHKTFQINEIYQVHLSEYIKYIKKGEKKIVIKDLINTIKTPLAALIGVSYGFFEGDKQSAREISIDNNYSLWTYRDMYELLVRIDKLEKDKKRGILISILSNQDGPVYKHISIID